MQDTIEVEEIRHRILLRVADCSVVFVKHGKTNKFGQSITVMLLTSSLNTTSHFEGFTSVGIVLVSERGIIA